MPRMPTVRVSVRSIHWPGASSLDPRDARGGARRPREGDACAKRDGRERRQEHGGELSLPGEPPAAGGDSDEPADDDARGPPGVEDVQAGRRVVGIQRRRERVDRRLHEAQPRPQTRKPSQIP
jgi:hypothetical protein